MPVYRQWQDAETLEQRNASKGASGHPGDTTKRRSVPLAVQCHPEIWGVHNFLEPSVTSPLAEYRCVFSFPTKIIIERKTGLNHTRAHASLILFNTVVCACVSMCAASLKAEPQVLGAYTYMCVMHCVETSGNFVEVGGRVVVLCSKMAFSGSQVNSTQWKNWGLSLF